DSHNNAEEAGRVATKKAAGTDTQKLRQLKQSIRPPTGLDPSRRRRRNTTSARPSSSASRWVTRQVARAASTNRTNRSSVRGTAGLPASVAADRERQRIGPDAAVDQTGRQPRPRGERRGVGAIGPGGGVLDDGSRAST